MRDYGIEPQVWGGDPNCAHEWGADKLQREQSGRERLEWQTGGNPSAKVNDGPVSQGAFCLHCNAWRGSLGLEPTLDLYLDHMVCVFREIRRVLRKDGTCWLNIGDSYSGSSGSGGKTEKQLTNTGSYHAGGIRKSPGFKPKDLMLIPSRLAIRLCDDGWWVRSDIAWCKKAPMPESCTDRPTTAWEHVFLLTKSCSSTYWTHRDHVGSRTKPEPDYRWEKRDSVGFLVEIAKEPPPNWREDGLRRFNLWQAHDYFYDQEAVKEEAAVEPHAPGNLASGRLGSGGKTDNCVHQSDRIWGNGKRNLRNYWLLGPEPYPEAHFATFVTEIPRIAINAGTSERGVCPKCGAPWERVIAGEKYSPPSAEIGERNVDLSRGDKIRKLDGKSTEWREAAASRGTIGWRPTCSCDAGDPVPATVLDPFLGAGTTALVADQLQRNAIGIELSLSYTKMAENRIRQDGGMLTEILVE